MMHSQRLFRRLAILACAAWCASGLAAQTVWQLSYTNHALVAEVMLNGCVVVKPGDGPDRSGSLLVGPWLKSGRNVLTIRLLASPDPEADPDLRSFRLSLSSYDRQAANPVPAEQFSLRLPAAGTDGLTLPRTLEYSLFVDNVPAVKLWTQAERLSLDAATLAEARALMEKAYAALDAKNPDAYFELYRWALADISAAFGWNPDDYTAQAAKALPALFSSAEFEFTGQNPASLEYSLAPGSGSLLLAVRGPGGSPAISAGPLSQETLYLARIGGKLVIARN